MNKTNKINELFFELKRMNMILTEEQKKKEREKHNETVKRSYNLLKKQSNQVKTFDKFKFRYVFYVDFIKKALICIDKRERY